MDIRVFDAPVPFQQIYQAQLEVMQGLLDDANNAPEVTFICQHEPTITLGRRFESQHLLISRDELTSQGVAVHEINRGGSVTAHEPGQLVIYPIVSLKKRGLRVTEYVKKLLFIGELLCGIFGITVTPKEDNPGLWVGDRKIASLGVEIKHHDITLHGLAININNTCDTFAHVMPCGITDLKLTTLSREVGYPLDWDMILDQTRSIVITSLG